MSPETLEFLARLLDGLTLQTGAPDFEESALLVIKAKHEVAEALAEATEAVARTPRQTVDRSPGSSES